MRTIIIDVRTPKEFSDDHLRGAINLPKGTDLAAYEPYRGQHIALMCESGRRAEEVFQELKLNGWPDVSIFHRHMVHLREGRLSSAVWTVDRQFRMALALFLLTFLFGIYAGWQWVWALPVIITAGLLFSAITDLCFLKMGIAKLPWNRRQSNLDSIKSASLRTSPQ